MVSEDDEESNKGRVTLCPGSTRPGLYVGYYTPPGAGRYRVQACEDDIDYANTIEFQVADIRPEMANTDMQIERLQRIAKLSGGKCLRLSQVQDLATSLDRTRHQTIIRGEQPLWDSWFFAVLVMGLAGFEWIVRRRFDLL